MDKMDNWGILNSHKILIDDPRQSLSCKDASLMRTSNLVSLQGQLPQSYVLTSDLCSLSLLYIYNTYIYIYIYIYILYIYMQQKVTKINREINSSAVSNKTVFHEGFELSNLIKYSKDW